VVTGHAGDENAAKLTRAQKEQLKETLSRPPSQSGVQADFWDVPALRGVVKILFDVEYQSDSTYQLLLKFCGMSFKLPDPFDKRRDEAAITARMARIRQEVAELPARGWEVRTVDGVRVEHEAETRRMRLPRGGRARLHVDRTRSARSFFGALSLTSKKMKIHPIEGNQNAERIILAMARLVRGTENEKIAVVLDNAGFHQAKAVTDLYEPGQALERIKPIHLPPCAPDHNPTEHVWNTAKDHIANIQHDTPRTNLDRIHQLHHQPHLRLQLRTPTNHTTRRKPCLTPARVFLTRISGSGRGSARCHGKDGRGVGVARTGANHSASPWALPRHHADPGQSGGLRSMTCCRNRQESAHGVAGERS